MACWQEVQANDIQVSILLGGKAAFARPQIENTCSRRQVVDDLVHGVDCTTGDSTARVIVSGAPCYTDAVMPISARNRLVGKIIEIQTGGLMAHVVVRVGKNTIESLISLRSAEELHLKKGDTVTAVIKSTEVMIQKG